MLEGHAVGLAGDRAFLGLDAGSTTKISHFLLDDRYLVDFLRFLWLAFVHLWTLHIFGVHVGLRVR